MLIYLNILDVSLYHCVKKSLVGIYSQGCSSMCEWLFWNIIIYNLMNLLCALCLAI